MVELVLETEQEGERRVVARHEGPLPVTLSAPRGARVHLRVTAEGRARHAEWLELTGDRAVQAPLGPGAVIRGRVVDERGSPVEGADVRLVRDGGPALPWVAPTDGDGRFSFNALMAGTYRAEASSRGHAPAVRDRVSAGSEAELVLRVERVGLVSGRVVGPDGAGTGGATIVIAGSGVWPARRATSG